MQAEAASRALLLTAVAATVVGLCSLAPHLRNETLRPVLLQGDSDIASAPLSVEVRGDVLYPGLYTVDSTTPLGEILDRAGGAAAPPAVTIVAGLPNSAAGDPQKVDVNRADAWLLEALPGIGADRAQAIIDFRLRHGPFTSTEQLLQVPGIGADTYDALREYITVSW